jgi:hypothetical protein
VKIARRGEWGGAKQVRRTADTVFVSPDVVYRDDWYE